MPTIRRPYFDCPALEGDGKPDRDGRHAALVCADMEHRFYCSQVWFALCATVDFFVATLCRCAAAFDPGIDHRACALAAWQHAAYCSGWCAGSGGVFVRCVVRYQARYASWFVGADCWLAAFVDGLVGRTDWRAGATASVDRFAAWFGWGGACSV